MNDSKTPRFAVRGINVCESLARHTPDQVATLIERMAKWKMNTLIVHSCYGYKLHRKLIEDMCGQTGIQIAYYVQTALAFNAGADPDIFALDTDLKPRTPKACNETRLCPSNETARNQFRSGAENFFKSDDVQPGSTLILMDADGYLFCQCPKCRNIKPVDQWAIFLEIALEQAEKANKALKIEHLSYVWRYAIPKNFEIFKNITGVLFDTHQRFRWRALNQPHPHYFFSELEAQADERAKELPLNQYLLERLTEWRKKFSGKLYVFENLMIQGSISCPQPYTENLLKDLDIYESLGLQGVVYEVFEPGIQSFEKQLDILSSALLTKPQSYQPSELEKMTKKLKGEEFIDYNPAVGYLALDEEKIISAIRADGFDELLCEYIILFRKFLLNRTIKNYNEVIIYVMKNRDRFDWQMAAFNLLRLIPKENIPSIDDKEFLKFINTNKLWDIQEEMILPVIETNQIIDRFIKSIDR